MIGRTEVAAAWQLIRPHVRRTPVIELPAGSFGIGATIALKLESLQPGGSFKARGALNKVLSLSNEDRARGLVTDLLELAEDYDGRLEAFEAVDAGEAHVAVGRRFGCKSMACVADAVLECC